MHLSITGIRAGSIGITGLCVFLFVAIANTAAAGLEVLAPETARDEVGASKGVVVVDLYADW